MAQSEFMNATGHMVWLVGPDGKKMQFNKFERKMLDDWYKRYVPKYLRLIITAPVQQRHTMKQAQHPALAMRGVMLQPIHKAAVPIIVQAPSGNQNRKIVGQVGMQNTHATTYLNQLVKNTSISISNDVGIGILSYNRLGSLQRLINSIRKFTDLLKTTVFISDESSDPAVKDYLKTIQDMVVINNQHRLGVAGNSNRLLKCLKRFKHAFILNDDIEILSAGWEQFYVKSSHITGIHHFCMRQPGVYGATSTEGSTWAKGDVRIQTINLKPHGAVLFYDQHAFNKVGYFDEEMFGIYGMEHVDWSNRISLSNIQPKGFHDIVGSTSFFKIHHEHSSVPERTPLYQAAKKKYETVKEDTKRIRIEASDKCVVPKISYVVPFRGSDRTDSINTVLRNIKAQRFPEIEIIMSEQDNQSVVKFDNLETFTYILAQTPSGQAFTKSVAFNAGVAAVTSKKVILHDADMLVHDGYTSEMSKLLDEYEGVHIGKSVLYLSPDSTSNVNQAGKLVDPQAERSVQYYEGGSLGCTVEAYVKIGGFNEVFVGYGMEDCEFFERLMTLKSFNQRSIDLVHLWHDRTSGWGQHHTKNKQLGKEIKMHSMPDRISKLHNELVAKYGKFIK